MRVLQAVNSPSPRGRGAGLTPKPQPSLVKGEGASSPPKRWNTLHEVALLLPLVFAALLFVSPAFAASPTRWAAYYGDAKTWEEFADYDLIVFDGESHPDVRPLVGRGKEVLAYLSLLEVEPSRPFFHKLKQSGLLLDTLPDGRALVDVRRPEWMKLLVEEIIPGCVRKGFTGLMFDTVDTALALEAEDPVKYRGMRKAVSLMIRHIKMHYPYLRLMVNRGFELLPEIDREIDMVLAESILIDSRESPARPFSAEHYGSVLETLAAAKARNPNLSLFSLDYWNMNDTEGVRRIYAHQRAAGFIPYVSTHDLQAIYAEP